MARGVAFERYGVLLGRPGETNSGLLPYVFRIDGHANGQGDKKIQAYTYGIRWAGLNLLARFRIREGMGVCVDMMNEFEWCSEQEQCIRPLKMFGGAAKEVIPRLRETLVAMRKGYEMNGWHNRLNADTLVIEQLIKEIEADQNVTPVLSIDEFVGKKGQP